MELAGKAAVVTGGAAGIGLALATALVEKGCSVMIADVEADEAEKAAASLREKGGTVEAAACDVRDYDAVMALADAAWSSFGRVDLVFANAGVMSGSSVIDYRPEHMDWIIDVNIKGVWNTVSIFGRRFRDAGQEAAICMTASEHAIGVPHLGGGIYTATKHAVLGMADVMRQELPENITVSLVFPGITQSKLYDSERNSPTGPTAEKAKEIGARVMAKGMDALVLARRTVEGVANGDFMIMTHPHIVGYAEKRWREISAAIAAVPPFDDSEQYDVARVQKEVLGG